MKRYLIFAGRCYYARGGFADLAGQADTKEEAIATCSALEHAERPDDFEWWQVVDWQTREIVARSTDAALGGEPGDAHDYNVMFMGGHLVPQAVDLGDDLL